MSAVSNLLYAVEQLCSDVEGSISGQQGAHKKAIAVVRAAMEKCSAPVAPALGLCETDHNLNHALIQMPHPHNGLTCKGWNPVDEPWVEWSEPFGKNNAPVLMRVRRSVAIARMKEVHPELSDEQALDEFIVVNWATLLEKR